eukprot:jgi/Hompol1/3027/HPOL_002368-RA
MNITVRAIAIGSERIPTLEIVLLRGVIGWSLGAIWAVWHKVDGGLFAQSRFRKLLMIRGMLGFLISVADATVLGFVAPVFTGLLGIYFLNEPYGIIDAISALVSLSGVLLIARPAIIFGSLFGANPGEMDPIIIPPDDSLPPDTVFDPINNATTTGATAAAASGSYIHTFQSTPDTENMRLAGVAAALLGALFVASAIVTIRKLSSLGVAPIHVVNYFHIGSIPFSVMLAPLLPHTVDPHPWILPTHISTWCMLIGTSLSGIFGQLLLSAGLKLEPAGRASSMNYFQAVFAILAEWLFWNIVPHWLSIIGGSIVLCSGLFVALFRRKTATLAVTSSQPASHPASSSPSI